MKFVIGAEDIYGWLDRASYKGAIGVFYNDTWSGVLAYMVWQNNMCKHYSAENRYRIKKCLNLLEYKSFQHNICMRSTKCEYRYYAGKC